MMVQAKEVMLEGGRAVLVGYWWVQDQGGMGHRVVQDN